MANTIEEIKKEFENSPYLRHLGVEILTFEEGDVKIKLAVQNYLLNTKGTLHGGVYASLLDFIQRMHLCSVTKKKCAVISSTVHFTAPVTTGIIYAEASIISKGFKTAFIEGFIRDNKGSLVSKGTGTYKLIH